MDLATPELPVAPLAAAEHFLARTDVLIDWPLVPAGMDIAGGATLPSYALKIALIKQWYGLADQGAPFQLLDRLSFRRFIGYCGDGGEVDAAIVQELQSCAWGHHPAMIDAIEAVQAHLIGLGYAVRCGRMEEPSLAPCTESGTDLQSASGATSVFRPGELGLMVEAVTAKAHAEGVVAPSPPAAGGTARHGAVVAVGDASPPERVAGARALLDWPWGQRTELAEHLNIGRDFQFSVLAKELTPYTHVSRRHAELLVYGDSVWVRDLGSRNGTFVNDEEVPKGQAFLIDADAVIRFGPLLAVQLKLQA